MTAVFRSALAKTFQVLDESGPLGFTTRLATFLYRHSLRPLLPTASPVRYADIPIALDRKLFDSLIPLIAMQLRDIPDYEVGLVRALEDYVAPGDKIVVIGGGWGVTTVLVAFRSAPNGQVTCFEGSVEGVGHVASAAKRNHVSDRVDVRHAVVGKALHVYGTSALGDIVAPSDLPACDLLELDCEGAELDILTEMHIRPRVVLVETHGCYGAPTEIVKASLEGIGYRVIERGVAEPRARSFCEENDIRVLIGELPKASSPSTASAPSCNPRKDAN